jgi:succinate-acetate transporter protein
MSSAPAAGPTGGGGNEQYWTKTGPVAVSKPAADVQRLQETQDVTIAEPAPLGLFGFAAGTIAIAYVLSGFTTGPAQIGTAPVLLVFAGIAQFIAGLWGFRKANTFAATAFCAYGANNTVVATFFLLRATGVIPENFATDVTLAIELFSFAYISLMLGIAALKLNPVFVAILWTLVPGFTLSGLGTIGTGEIIGHVGGYWLMASALLAFYAAGAVVVNSLHGREVLPLFGKA